jgi:hypothetical protein
MGQKLDSRKPAILAIYGAEARMPTTSPNVNAFLFLSMYLKVALL